MPLTEINHHNTFIVIHYALNGRIDFAYGPFRTRMDAYNWRDNAGLARGLTEIITMLVPPNPTPLDDDDAMGS